MDLAAPFLLRSGVAEALKAHSDLLSFPGEIASKETCRRSGQCRHRPGK